MICCIFRCLLIEIVIANIGPRCIFSSELILFILKWSLINAYIRNIVWGCDFPYFDKGQFLFLINSQVQPSIVRKVQMKTNFSYVTKVRLWLYLFVDTSQFNWVQRISIITTKFRW